MKAQADKRAVDSVVDHKRPWSPPRLKYELFSPYPYRLSRTQWRNLLAEPEVCDADAGAKVAAY